MNREIFSVVDPERNIPLGLKMFATLSGFADAGGSVSQVQSNIFANFDAQLVILFNNDELLDYRSRRPSVYFDKDHIELFEPAVLGIYLLRDEIGQQFLYLDGYEPDFRWEAFADSIQHLMNLLAVSEFVWIHSVPFPLPHTRPIGITVSGNRKDMIDRYSEWRPETQVPGTAMHLIEFRLREVGIATTGFVFLVPHYLGDSEYPDVALKAFELVTAATGLVFPTDALRDEARSFAKRLEEKMAENGDLAKIVANLEQGYQAGKNATFGARVTPNSSKVPDADEIAAELEDFLATRTQNKPEEDN